MKQLIPDQTILLFRKGYSKAFEDVFNKYQKALQNLIKTKRELENRPTLVEVRRPKQRVKVKKSPNEANYDDYIKNHQQSIVLI